MNFSIASFVATPLSTISFEVIPVNSVIKVGIKISHASSNGFTSIDNPSQISSLTTLAAPISINEEMIEFQLHDNGTDMFKEVADDIINQLNSEIRLSEENFNEFLELMKQ
ncbi:hypothetical protein [Listeria monocytogenes]|uniref:hypothetical protein n=1 Tax=Listeria monocytogenes TaxID=1639 RepID=UPI00165DAF89|nr:hypothetical protein [Listeria monocytogenes]